MIDPLDLDIVEFIKYCEENPDFKGDEDITVKVNDVLYRIPYYCFTDLFFDQPDDFFPCNRYEWADHPKYFTSIEIVKKAIEQRPGKFISFILYTK